MPNYDYQCLQCGHQEEILQKMTDAPLTVCTQCKSSAFKRKFGKGTGLHFQGSGFYCTDYSPQSPPSQKKPLSNSAKNCGCHQTECTS